ncbi:DIS3-like exonuclease 1 [Achlya hypogyna]|uniref:DIS3-like exonuclease 1 n=1 Tax=Achlya hypogyna TaxID=1202772 RepID=A0A1V9YYU9_ACHHY|nr:DIS3-like exonuclease 1 [Achlya hypogyna]
MASGADVFLERRFLEKSRRKKPGNVKAVETYLRDDVHCALSPCRTCQRAGLAPPRAVVRASAPYILVPDATALATYLDLLEMENFNATQVLLLQTVLDRALDLASSREVGRMEAWLDETSDKSQLLTVGYFPNRHFRGTFVPTHVQAADGHLEQESFADRDHRAFVRALLWYTQHSISASFVVLSDDTAVATALAAAPRTRVLSCTAYIAAHARDPSPLVALANELARSFATRAAKGSDGSSYKDLNTLSASEYDTGRLAVSAHHPLEAFVKTRSGTSIFVYGRDAMNRAVHGDLVAVQLLPETDWLVPESKSTLVHVVTDDHKGVVPAGGAGVPTGRVINVLERSSRLIVATILSTTVDAGDDYVLAVPMDLRYPKVRLRTLNATELVDHRLTVAIDAWPLDSFYPAGHYVQVLGPVGDLETEVAALLVQHATHAARFSERALACLPDVGDVDWDAVAICDTSRRPRVPLTREWCMPAAEIAARRDLRASHRVFSVDPPGCQDIDDAMSVRRLPNGHWELGVHIADVGYFVAADSALDRDARHRATTVYLVDRRFDMLPVLLSGDLCSLHGQTDRFAFSVFWELDDALEIVPGRTTFAKTVVHSAAAMTYGQADRLLRGLSADDPQEPPVQAEGTAGRPVAPELQAALREDLEVIRAIGRKLYARRAATGAVDLTQGSELKFTQSDERDWSIKLKEALEIHGTIAELMILANATVAERLVRCFPETALLRRHVSPTGDRFDALLALAAAKKLPLDTTSNMTLQASLEAVAATVDADTLALLKSMATRAMSEAEYICASAATGGVSHYGLGLTYYTHFTSPIRRYADVVVHRQLLETLAPPQAASKSPVPASKPVRALPASLTPSVLATGYVAPTPLLPPTEAPATSAVVQASTVVTAFPAHELVPQSEHMNVQNRNAKNVARACEELFLALYFQSHSTTVTAVVTAVKQNGLLVFVPQFDVRGPVYLKDRDGAVHVHATMVPPAAGVAARPARPGFDAALRELPGATLQLEEEASLRVLWRGACVASFAPLMEIQVRVACDAATASARLPQLRLSLAGDRPVATPPSDVVQDAVAALHSSTTTATVATDADTVARQLQALAMGRPSLYAALPKASETTIAPTAKATAVVRDKKAPGRVVFGRFEPPVPKKFNKLLTAHYEGRSAELEAAMTIERGAIVDVTASSAKRYEQDALRRVEKLMAEKRHDRINSRRKANQ